MGSGNSKKVIDKISHSYNEGDFNEEVNTSCDDLRVDSVNKFDEQIISRIKRDLSETPELFVLNNILMAVMFFENYQKEVQELSPKRYEKEEDCVIPDILLEKVNNNVVYRPLHGPKKYSSEPLVAKRMYVLCDSIRVVNSFENAVDNKEKSAVRLEESPRNGFVRLKELEQLAIPNDEDIPLSKNEITPSTSRSSTDSDTTYGYFTLNEIKTPKPLEIIRGLEKKDALPNLPLSCKSYRKVKRVSNDLDMDEEEVENITEDDLYDTISYVNSKGFMKYFQNNLFPNRVASNLGFDQVELSMAKSIPGKIFCNMTEGDNSTPCEVIPALPIQWPYKQTLEFLMKGQKPPAIRKRYIFPTQRMINEMRTLSSVLVPKGYIRKKGQHLDSEIEWEIHFPQAEKYLQSFMSHAQVKSFLLLLTLHKTYIEPKTNQLGLLPEHIRSFLFWECEENYSDWPEHRLGTKLINIIHNFNTHISKGQLRDYFIKDKNVFENIPKKYLRHSQKVFHDILDSPVMSFIKSLRNLRYNRGKSFYQPLDFEQLYNILTKTGIESTNPQIISDLSVPPNFKKKRFQDTDIQLKHLKEVKKREKVVQKRLGKKEKENLTDTEERRGSADSINMGWTCDKQFDIYKKRALLCFFIQNFIDIAEKCSQISSHKQTLFYLKQARYLTRIMGDQCPAFEVEVDDFMKRIKTQEDKCNKKAAKEGVPSPITQEETVQFSTNFGSTTDLKESYTDKSFVNTNGIKPRKSVAFVETH